MARESKGKLKGNAEMQIPESRPAPAGSDRASDGGTELATKKLGARRKGEAVISDAILDGGQ